MLIKGSKLGGRNDCSALLPSSGGKGSKLNTASPTFRMIVLVNSENKGAVIPVVTFSCVNKPFQIKIFRIKLTVKAIIRFVAIPASDTITLA